jgi:RNA methyltransferase, TrmH family
MTLITSPTNPRITNLKHLHSARGRKKSGHFLLEGPHLLEAILDADLLPTEVYYQPELLQRTAEGRALLGRLQRLSALKEDQLVEVGERVIEAIGEVQTSQGVVSILPLKIFEPEHLRTLRDVRKRPVLLILDAIADPGNMGTILRTALAADVETVLLTPECVDYFSPKVLRAAAGAHVKLPVEVAVSWLEIAMRTQIHCQGRVMLAEAGSDHMYFDQDLRQPFALIIGNEAHGPSQEARELASQVVTIPLENGVESLNVAMATGILLYESVRQKQKWQG